MSAPPPVPPARLSPWQARLLHRPARADLVYAAAVLGLGALTLWAGNLASRSLSPAGARSASELLDDLELPGALPNAVLVRHDGTPGRLWEVAAAPRNLVTFYAPWCGPCQEELPILARGTEEQPERLTVVVGAAEDPQEVRRKLGNLGLADLPFHVDTTGELQAGARVTALPTTFLVARVGRVRERIVGSSQYRLHMLVWKATNKIPTPGGLE